MDRCATAAALCQRGVKAPHLFVASTAAGNARTRARARFTRNRMPRPLHPLAQVVEKPTEEALADKKKVLLYFSASVREAAAEGVAFD